jgi:hypothetical protein
MPFTLDEPTQGSLSVSVRFGSDLSQCALFGGTVVADHGIGAGVGGIFKARGAAEANGTCLVP